MRKQFAKRWPVLICDLWRLSRSNSRIYYLSTRVRSRLISQRTGLINHLRALLSEYGVILPQGITHIRRHLRPILDDTDNELTSVLREVLYELLDEFLRLDEGVKALDQKLKEVCTHSEACKRLLDIPSIGPITASALVSSIGDIHQFKNARHLSTWLGLVPRQHSSRSKQTLLGISNRGRYIFTKASHPWRQSRSL